MADAVANMRLYQCPDLVVLEIPFTYPAVVDGYNVDLDAKGDWDLLDVLRYGEIDISSCLGAELTGISDIGVETSVEFQTKASGVFKLVLCGLNSFGEQGELLASVDRLGRGI